MSNLSVDVSDGVAALLTEEFARSCEPGDPRGLPWMWVWTSCESTCRRSSSIELAR